MGDRYESLQPPSLTATVASMPRRWKEAFHVPAPKSVDEVFTIAGPDGTSPAEHLGATISMITTLADAIRTTSYSVPEPLGPEVGAAVANAGSGPWPDSAHEGLDSLISLMERLLEQLEQLSPSDWNRSADSGTQTYTVLALAQGASRVAAERLAKVDRLIDTLAG
ncbi:MAG: hypothetical protein R8J94_14360 [Acidimicrobiia bacterium]|nr:hypothetical protein [Acidimicrobiia bacterium]